jgi:hypothetical protein
MAKDELCSSIGGSQSFGRNISRPTPGNPRTTNKLNAGKGDPVLKHRDLNSIQSKKRLELDLKHLPIPRGNSPYALAKRAEYEEKDLAKAEEYYKQAILQGERVESAIKDLASVMHQQGKTKDACEFLRKHRRPVCLRFHEVREPTNKLGEASDTHRQLPEQVSKDLRPD